MIAAVADTHAAVWYLAKDSRLSFPAKNFMDAAGQNGDQIAVSSITLVEMIYLVEKGRIPPERFSHLVAEMDKLDSMFTEIPLDIKISRALSRVDVVQVPDMPDRIIAATGLYLGVPVISRDGKIRASNLQSLW